jgi:hypothetical protein
MCVQIYIPILKSIKNIMKALLYNIIMSLKRNLTLKVSEIVKKTPQSSNLIDQKLFCLSFLI